VRGGGIPGNPLCKRVSGAQGRYGSFGEDRNLLPFLGIKMLVSNELEDKNWKIKISCPSWE